MLIGYDPRLDRILTTRANEPSGEAYKRVELEMVSHLEEAIAALESGEPDDN